MNYLFTHTICNLLLWALLLFSLPMMVLGASFTVVSDRVVMGVQQEFQIVVYVDSQDEHINAIGGGLSIPDSLQIIDVQVGKSIISLWVKQPQVTNGQTVAFEGIIPGGWSGLRGELLTLIVRTKDIGVNTATLQDMRVLLHDGEGTETRAEVTPLQYEVREGVRAEPRIVEADTEPPRAFTILLEDTVDMFDGQAFIVFSTKDTGSGIKHYEVLESQRELHEHEHNAAPWVRAESPHLLQDQSLQSFVYVRATDKKGNVRVSAIAPTQESLTTDAVHYGYLLWLLPLIIYIGIVVRKMYKRYYKYPIVKPKK